MPDLCYDSDIDRVVAEFAEEEKEANDDQITCVPDMDEALSLGAITGDDLKQFSSSEVDVLLPSISLSQFKDITIMIHALNAGRDTAGPIFRACLDTGCKRFNFMGFNMISILKAAGIEVDLRLLDSPEIVASAWKGRVACNHVATVQVTVRTTYGPCVFRPVELLVADNSVVVDCVYLGTTFMSLLGIEPPAEQLGRRFGGKIVDLTTRSVRELGSLSLAADGSANVHTVPVEQRAVMNERVTPVASGDIFFPSNLDMSDPGSFVAGEAAYFDADVVPTSDEMKVKLDLEAHRELAECLENARAAGLSMEDSKKLESYIILDNCRSQLVSDGPIRVESAPTILLPDVVLAQHSKNRIIPRNYSSEHRAFLVEFLERLRKAGIIRRVMTAYHAAPLIVVKKANGAFRMVFDLRSANRHVQKSLTPAMSFEYVVHHLLGARYFSTYDLTDAFYQLPLDEMGRRIYTFIGPNGEIYEMLRAPQGSTNAAANFQSAMMWLLDQCGLLYVYVLVYIDDLIIYASNMEDFLEAHRLLHLFFQKYNIKLKLSKAVLFAREIKWLGKLLSSEGYRQDPARIAGLLRMQPPADAAALSQFIGACGWLRSTLPRYAIVMLPLRDLKTECTRIVGSAESKRLVKLDLVSTGLWLESHQLAWEGVRSLLRESICLSIPDPVNKRYAVFCDASDIGWGHILLQYWPKNEGLPHAERGYEILAVYSGTWTDVQIRWSVYDREGFSFTQSILQNRSFLEGVVFEHYTDHRNLIYLFGTATSGLSRDLVAAARVTRWAIMLQGFRFFSYHIPGEINLFADLLSRIRENSSTIVPDVSSNVSDDVPVLGSMQLHSDIEDEEYQSFFVSENTTGRTLAALRRSSRTSVPTDHFVAGPASGRLPSTVENQLSVSNKKLISDVSNEPVVSGPSRGLDLNDSGSSIVEAVSAPKVVLSSSHTDAVKVNPTRSKFRIRKTRTGKLLNLDQARIQADILAADDFDIPHLGNILSLQQKYLDIALKGNLIARETIDNATLSGDVFQLPHDISICWSSVSNAFVTAGHNLLWIPRDARAAQISICCFAHSYNGIHCSGAETLRRISLHYDWKGRNNFVALFVSQCLHCISTRTARVIPRPLASTIHGKWSNHVLRMDFIFIGDGELSETMVGSMPWNTEFKWILVMRDDTSEYVELVPCRSCTALEAVNGYIQWISRFNTPDILCVDLGSHFVNQLFDLIVEKSILGAIVPTVASNKRTAGGIEVINRIVLRILRGMISHFKMDLFDWPVLIPVVRHYMNNLPRVTLGGAAPISLFQGRKREDPLEYIIKQDERLEKALVDNEWTPDIELQLVELQRALAHMHQVAVNVAEHRRAKRRFHENGDLDVEDFEIGDYVLRSVPPSTSEDNSRPKLLLTHYPMQVVQVISPDVYVCQDLVTKSIRTVHGQYLTFYALPGTFVVDDRVIDQIKHAKKQRTVKSLLEFAYFGKDGYFRVLFEDGSGDDDAEWISASTALSQVKKKALSQMMKVHLEFNEDAQVWLSQQAT